MLLNDPIDISPLATGRIDASSPEVLEVAAMIDQACRTVGFFTVTGHGVDPALRRELESVSQRFFGLDEHEKARVSMENAGRAWRGWFPAGAELTSGIPDSKEGLYFGLELAADDERVLAGLPLHGPNLWPERPEDLRRVVTAWMAEMDRVGRSVLATMAIGLGLDPAWFDENLTADPVQLFRIFHYLPPVGDGSNREALSGDSVDPRIWGVGAHTDYGLLTLLAQDHTGGLEVDVNGQWVAVEPRPDVLVCNIGDMLDRMTSGAYLSTLHRVRPPSGRSRLSFPFFFDPGWDVEIRPLPVDTVGSGGAPGGPIRQSASARTSTVGHVAGRSRQHRWDGTDLAQLSGTYGEYLARKVALVFPALQSNSQGDGGIDGSG